MGRTGRTINSLVLLLVPLLFLVLLSSALLSAYRERPRRCRLDGTASRWRCVPDPPSAAAPGMKSRRPSLLTHDSFEERRYTHKVITWYI